MTTTRSTSAPSEATPTLSEEAMPEGCSGLTSTRARPRSTRLWISSAAAPSTTTTSSRFDSLTWPTTSSSSGLSLTISNCLGLPMRREEPAASTRPVLLTPSGFDASEVALGFLLELFLAPSRAEPVGRVVIHGLVLRRQRIHGHAADLVGCEDDWRCPGRRGHVTPFA